MIKNKILILVAVGVFCCGEKTPQAAPLKRVDLPENAVRMGGPGGWYVIENIPKGKKMRVWDNEKDLRAISYFIGKWQSVERFTKMGHLEYSGQNVRLDWKSQHDDEQGHGVYGKWKYYNVSQKLIKIECKYPLLKDVIYERNCGKEIHFNPDGSVQKTIRHPKKCPLGCGEFKPFMPPGRYYVIIPSLRVRAKPTTEAKEVFTVTLNQVVEVLKDTRKIETHAFETAPWVKIKAKDGKTGYAFGGFLYKEGEKFVDMTD